MNNYKFTDAQMRVINVMVTYFDELGINPKYKEDMIKKGLDVVGTSIDGKLVDMIEIPKHIWFLACQFHPEFTSNPRDGHPIFNSYIKSTLKK